MVLVLLSLHAIEVRTRDWITQMRVLIFVCCFGSIVVDDPPIVVVLSSPASGSHASSDNIVWYVYATG